MKKEKTCGICKKEIFQDDDYAELKHYPNGELGTIGYYHTECFRNVHFANRKIQNQAKGILAKAGTMLEAIR